MTRRVIIRPEAEAELGEAHNWYETHRGGLGAQFLLCLDACVASIERNPAMYPIVHRNVRRALVRRFPYGVFYVIGEGAVSVIAIVHSSRHPAHWQNRSEAPSDESS